MNSRCQETQHGGLQWLKYKSPRPGFDICVSQSKDRFGRRVYQTSEEPVSHWATSSHPKMRRLCSFQTLRSKMPLAAGSPRGHFPQVESSPSGGFLLRLEAPPLLLPQREGHMFMPSEICDRLPWNHVIPYPVSLTTPSKC